MNCSNCGAILRLAPGRGHLRCEYCDAITLLEDADLGPDRVVVFSGRSDVSCPVCRKPLREASIDYRSVLSCKDCHGVLLSKGDFGDVVRHRRRRYSQPLEVPPPINPVELGRSVDCPLCSKKMETHPYYGPGAVVIDSCAPCEVVWLDCGELRAIETAPGNRG